MSKLTFHRVANSATLIAASALFASSAFAADPLSKDSHDVARRLIQPAVAAPAATTGAGPTGDAHDQAVSLIVTGSAHGTSAPSVPSNAATAGASDPHQFARDHLRWTIAAN